MFIRELNDCPEFIAGDNCMLREILHPDKSDLTLRYSLAHAVVKPGQTTWKHRLKTSEVYYILEGQGLMHINDDSKPVKPGSTVYIPPRTEQSITNTGNTDLKFICIVDPAWRSEDEEVVEQPRIRQCLAGDFAVICSIINDAALAFKGHIPADCWKEPYMTEAYLRHEIDSGVTFWGYENNRKLAGVMGIQNVEDVALIRHAYVHPADRNKGIGGMLISHLMKLTARPALVGTWAAAEWAIRFYEKHGFRLVAPAEKDRLLRKYWSIAERQTATSVVLADRKWFEQGK